MSKFCRIGGIPTDKFPRSGGMDSDAGGCATFCAHRHRDDAFKQTESISAQGTPTRCKPPISDMQAGATTTAPASSSVSATHTRRSSISIPTPGASSCRRGNIRLYLPDIGQIPVFEPPRRSWRGIYMRRRPHRICAQSSGERP